MMRRSDGGSVRDKDTSLGIWSPEHDLDERGGQGHLADKERVGFSLTGRVALADSLCLTSPACPGRL
jgi:hypothetical protein